jgi:hypothetical protein
MNVTPPAENGITLLGKCYEDIVGGLSSGSNGWMVGVNLHIQETMSEVVTYNLLYYALCTHQYK